MTDQLDLERRVELLEKKIANLARLLQWQAAVIAEQFKDEAK